jgi:CelD/BcsL family acetyltransferase involved in cellulose biosynthesis
MELVTHKENPTYSVSMARGGRDADPTRCAWESLIGSRKVLGSPENSPLFYDHLLKMRGGEALALASVRDDLGAMVGVVPLAIESVPLQFDVSWYVLAETALKGVTVLGDGRLLPPRPMVYDLFFSALAREFPECGIVKFKSLATSNPLWHYLQHSAFVRELFEVYVPDGVRSCHTIPLPATCEEYLGRFNAKKRYNLKRQERLLRDHGGGNLELRRIESRDQVHSLVEDIKALGGTVRTARRRFINSYATPILDEGELGSLADHGLLLCYVLRCGGQPCAAALGSILDRVYHLDSLPRNRSFDRFSPGATLVHLLLEDLISRQSADLIDFGFGEPSYRHSATNVTEARASVLLLRRTFTNRMKMYLHASFKGIVGRLKRVLKSI